jgi:hypothetical protein
MQCMFIDVFITVLGIVHLPVFYLKSDISETELCLHIQVESTEMCPIERLVSISEHQQQHK